MTATLRTADDTATEPVVDAPVRLAPGVELLGEYQDSGFSLPQYLLRRPDGQTVLLSQLLYLVAAALRDHDRPAAVAKVLEERLGRPVSAANVEHLIITKLRPAGVIAAPGDEAVAAPRANPLLGLTLRAGLVPERLHRALTTALRPLYHLPAVLAVVAAVAALDGWIVTHHDALMAASLQIASQPSLVLLMTGLVLLSLAFHEIGHATACRYSGGRPSTMGVGIYLVWPAFYTDVTDAYRLDRAGRLRTDLGGIYFNALFALAAGAGYAATGFKPLLATAVLAQVQALYQLLPFVRLDGYHILGDLIGIPNLFAYLRATVTTLLPTRRDARRQAERTLAALRRPARRAVKAWVALTVPVLAVNLALAAYLAPRTLPVLWRSAQASAHQLAAAAADGRWLTVANLAVQLLFLLFPILGWGVILLRLGGALTRGLAALTRRHLSLRHSPRLRPDLVAFLAAALLAVALVAGGHLLDDRSPATVTFAAPARSDAEAPTARPAAQPTTTPAAAASPTASQSGLDGPAPSPPGRGAVTLTVTGPSNPGLATAALSPVPSSALTWTVQAGDDLWSIAQHVQAQGLGQEPTDDQTASYWRKLIDANRATLTTPDVLYAGQVLTLPAPPDPPPAHATTQTAKPATASPPPTTAHQPPADETGPAATWTVQPGEDLWSIAEQVQAQMLRRAPTSGETSSYWEQLVDANRATVATPDLLHAGQVLTIPGLLSASPEVRPR